jgi:hypothetical protein
LKLPKHMYLRIVHNAHAVNYEPLDAWLENQFLSGEAGGFARDEIIRPEDLAEIQRTGEVWTIDWCPSSPVGSRGVIAATLERALELANDGE